MCPIPNIYYISLKCLMVLVDPILEIAMHEFGHADSPGVFDGRQAVFFLLSTGCAVASD